jgi:hypothetical protein
MHLLFFPVRCHPLGPVFPDYSTHCAAETLQGNMLMAYRRAIRRFVSRRLTILASLAYHQQTGAPSHPVNDDTVKYQAKG